MTRPDFKGENTNVKSPILYLQFRPTLKAWSSFGTDALPKSRKARALLALVALSDDLTISRKIAATLIWSSLERADGLARLRHTLHYLQHHLIAQGVAPMQVSDSLIKLRLETVQLDFISNSPDGNGNSPGSSEFLSDLDGINPTFDRWLIHIRSKKIGMPSPDLTFDEQDRRGSARWIGRGPSLVVTRFDSVGPETEEHLARTFFEEVSSALTMLRWVEIVTRSNKGHAFTFSDTEFPVTTDYLLVGSLQRDQNQYKLSLKLLDLRSSGQIQWAGDFLGETKGPFAMQTAIAHRIAATLDTELLYIEARRRKRLIGLEDTDAFTLVLLAIPDIYRLNKNAFKRAGLMLSDAVSLDPESAFAHSWLAYWSMFLIGQGWATNPTQAMAQAGRAANRAMFLDPKDARAATIAGHVRAFLNRQLEEAAALHEFALQLNPALGLAWHLYGMVHAYAGRLDEAYTCVCRCLELTPNNPHGFYAEGALGIIYLLQGKYDAAATVGRRVTERHPLFTSAYKSYLAALGHLGQKSEAAAVLQRLTSLEPRFSLQRFRSSAHYERLQDLDRFVTGLRLAGLT